MLTISKILLAAFFYLVMLPARLWFANQGQDMLQLQPIKKSSYWLEREPATDMESYFSQSSPVELVGRDKYLSQGGIARYLMPFFLFWARLFAPAPAPKAEVTTSAGATKEGIPDEIYTLW